MINIAHLLPYSAAFPLKKHNGRYEWALRLAALQAAKGHKVTIYSAPESGNGPPAVHWRSHGKSFKDATTNNIANLKAAFQDQQHDIYHSHFDYLHYFVADTTTKPVVCTQHWFPDEDFARAARFNSSRNVTSVPPTAYMAEKLRELGMQAAKTIYHGIDLELFKPTDSAKSNRFIFVGRIAPHKGVGEAVQIAKAAHINLDIVGKVNQIDQPYWQTILPHVDGEKIRYLGPKNQKEVAALMASAKAMIFPAQIIESFGQTTIEAQACGTPVIIQDIGASGELVQPEKTGFLVTSQAEYLEAIQKIDRLNPDDCRSFAETFDQHTMAASYEELYMKLLIS